MPDYTKTRKTILVHETRFLAIKCSDTDIEAIWRAMHSCGIRLKNPLDCFSAMAASSPGTSIALLSVVGPVDIFAKWERHPAILILAPMAGIACH